MATSLVEAVQRSRLADLHAWQLLRLAALLGGLTSTISQLLKIDHMFTELPLDSAWPPIFDDGPPIIHVDSLSPATLLLYPNGNPLLALGQM